MNKYILVFFLILQGLLINVTSQVVVKMSLPEQPSEALSAATLYDEILPTNIPIVFGPMGYDITGGQEPYSFQWIENETILSENNITTITLLEDGRYSLVIRDANNCSVTLPLITDRTINLDENKLQNKPINVFYSAKDGQLYIQSLKKSEGTISLILYDIKGVKCWEKKMEASGSMPFTPPSGIYLLSITGINHYQTEKIIVP